MIRAGSVRQPLHLDACHRPATIIWSSVAWNQSGPLNVVTSSGAGPSGNACRSRTVDARDPRSVLMSPSTTVAKRSLTGAVVRSPVMIGGKSRTQTGGVRNRSRRIRKRSVPRRTRGGATAGAYLRRPRVEDRACRRPACSSARAGRDPVDDECVRRSRTSRNGSCFPATRSRSKATDNSLALCCRRAICSVISLIRLSCSSKNCSSDMVRNLAPARSCSQERAKRASLDGGQIEPHG